MDMWLLAFVVIGSCGLSTVSGRDAIIDAFDEVGRLFNYSGASDYDLEILPFPRQAESSLEVRRRSFAAQVAELATYKLCNNVFRPHSGAALSAFQRIMPADYDDGISSSRTSVDGDRLPDPCFVAESLSRWRSGHHNPSMSVSAFFVHWSHFLYDDMASTAPFKLADGNVPACCAMSRHPECAPLQKDNGIPPPFGCYPYVRTQMAPAQRCRLGSRQQMNMGSSFIDGGPIYGRTYEDAEKRRTGEDDQHLVKKAMKKASMKFYLI